MGITLSLSMIGPILLHGLVLDSLFWLQSFSVWLLCASELTATERKLKGSTTRCQCTRSSKPPTEDPTDMPDTHPTTDLNTDLTKHSLQTLKSENGHKIVSG